MATKSAKKTDTKKSQPKDGWKMDMQKDQKFVDAIGEEIYYWYE